MTPEIWPFQVGSKRSNMIIPPDDIISKFPGIATEWRCCKNGAWISLYKGQLSKPVDRTSPMIQKQVQTDWSDRDKKLVDQEPEQNRLVWNWIAWV